MVLNNDIRSMTDFNFRNKSKNVDAWTGRILTHRQRRNAASHVGNEQILVGTT